MGATIQTVRKHEQQLAALIAGMQQLMDGQAALGETVSTQSVQISALIDEVERLMAETSALREGMRELEPMRG